MIENAVYTIFGSTGDLTYRKLMPALFNLFSRGLVADDVLILAIGRQAMDKEQYIQSIKLGIEDYARYAVDDNIFAKFSKHIEYFQMDFKNADEYNRLYSFYDEILWQNRENIKYLFYLAVSPSFFSVISQNLLDTGCLVGDRKVIIEKPFGRDYLDAKKITEKLATAFGMDNIYHIDHYLGKEMVQNILTLRRENALFYASWNKEHIDYIEISALEDIDVGSRGSYYDETGTLKDMIQSHLFQILTFVAMEEEVFESRNFQIAQEYLLRSLRTPENCVLEDILSLGQYEGYLDTKDVSPDSKTETYAALKVFIDNQRWQGVPFYLRSGKSLKAKHTSVVINYKQLDKSLPANRLEIVIQPKEGINVSFIIKEPGSKNTPKVVSMDFFQNSEGGLTHSNTPEAYERLLHAAYEGEKEMFTPWKQIETSWEWMHTLRLLREKQNLAVETYPKNSWGPKSADALLAKNNHKWSNELK